jgi:hypothetical protein
MLIMDFYCYSKFRLGQINFPWANTLAYLPGEQGTNKIVCDNDIGH